MTAARGIEASQHWLQIYWNHVMELITGYSAKEVLGQPSAVAYGFYRNEYTRRAHVDYIRNAPDWWCALQSNQIKLARGSWLTGPTRLLFCFPWGESASSLVELQCNAPLLCLSPWGIARQGHRSGFTYGCSL
jgi:hypothetical protein